MQFVTFGIVQAVTGTPEMVYEIHDLSIRGLEDTFQAHTDS
jgi:hypothetical protein